VQIETQTGASTYTIDSQAIVAQPGGGNQSFNQVLLQAPGVVQDSFGQLHVRGDHNGLQYRLNGVILPEGISVFSQTLSPRLVSSVSLITGALPAEYGLRTAGVIDLTSNSGLLQPGGSISLYGGSFGTIQPAFEYGGRSGSFSYYATGDYKQSDLGIESPDGSAVPLHDHTKQIHGFGYLEKILNENDRLSLILGISDGKYQIPNQSGLQPTLGLEVQGVTQFLSDNLDENPYCLTQHCSRGFSAIFSSGVAMPRIAQLSFRHGGPTAARADAVKVGRRADLEAGAAVDRPHLDGVEHDAMLEPSQDGTWTSGDRSLWVMLLRVDCVIR